MKKLIAFSLALVMLACMIPATLITAAAAGDAAYLDLSDNHLVNTDNGAAFVVTDKTTATLDGASTAAASEDALYLKKVIEGKTEPSITQTIKIEDMPVFETQGVSGNYYRVSGYYNNLQRNRRHKSETDTTYISDWIQYGIYRKDAEGNLGMKVYNLIDPAGTQEIALNKKLGDEFKLTTVWHADGKVTFYCDGNKLGTYENVTYTHKAYYHIECLFMGYFNFGFDDENYADGNVKLSVSNVAITDAAATPPAATPSTPAESTPAESTPAESTPATTPSTPATTPSTPAATAPATNPETGDAGMNAAYVATLTVSMMAVAALMIPEIRNKLIRK